MSIPEILLLLAVAAALVHRLRDLRGVELTLAGVPLLEDLDPEEPGEWPGLSVVVAARNEADKLPAALESLLAQDYPELQVVLVNDRSEDATGEIMQRASAGDSRVEVVEIDELPRNWLGKVNALQQGMERAAGEFVLFMDADIQLAEGVLRRTVAHAEAEELDHLATFAEMTPAGTLIDSIVTVFTERFFVRTEPWRVNEPDSPAAVGAGAFNLFRRAALKRTPGLEWLRLEVAEDVGLAEMIKEAGGRTRVLNGRGQVWLQWYSDLAGLREGMERIALITSVFRPWLSLLLGIGFLTVELVPFAGLVLLPRPFALSVALPAVMLGFWSYTRAGLWSRGMLTPGLAWPLGSLLFGWFMLSAWWSGVREGGLSWRETFYSFEQLRRGRRLWVERERDSSGE